MTTQLVALGIVAVCLPLAWLWHRHDVRRQVATDRAAWRLEIARGLSEAAAATAAASEAASEAITTIAEAIQSTGEMGLLESRVLMERVKAGAQADDRRSRQDLLMRLAATLQGLAGARELIRVMLPETRRDTGLQGDAITLLDATESACKGLPTLVTNPTS
ncbi:MAG: hypothetical protein Q8O14_07655 [bacterium]|nr:hypothetical protein [bacterium]